MTFELMDMLEQNCRGPAGDRRAVSVDGAHVTYRQLRDRALGLAAGLKSLGVEVGTSVGMMMGNRIEHIEAIFAVSALGGVFVPINVLFRGEEAMYLCSNSDVTVLLADEHAHRAIAVLSELVPTVVVVGGAKVPGAIAYESLVLAPDDFGAPAPAADRTLAHYYTSGTTGRPKAAVHTHSTLLHNAFQWKDDVKFTDADVFLGISSLTWAAGLNSGPLALLMAGGEVALHPTGGVTVESIIDHVIASRATCTVIAPTMLRKLSLNPEQMARLRETPLRMVFSGGEPLPAEIIEALGVGVPNVGFCQGYGLTEFPTMACALMPHEAVAQAGKTGRATTGVRIAVRTSAGTIQDAGSGELLIRSNATMVSYLDQPEETERAFADGWLNTGDLVTIDEHGYVTITGRSKEVIISGALNIYPAEIERLILQFDGVEEVAVIGIPDPEWGEVPVAVLRIADGGPSPEEILDRCRKNLATYKVPRRIIATSAELPRTVSGKLRKPSIKEWALTHSTLRSNVTQTVVSS